MSNWRDGSNQGSGNRDEEKKKKEKRLPVVSRPAPPPAHSPVSNRPKSKEKDWRGNAKSSDARASANERSWIGVARTSASQTTSLVKLGIVGSLGILIAILVTSFIVEVLRSHPKLPIILSIAGDYSALDIAENPFGQKSIDSITNATSKTQNLTIISSKKDSDEFVREVNSNADWLSGFSGKKILSSTGMMSTGKQLKGGGPGRNVTAFFISCRMAQSKNGKWNLLYHDDDPFRDPLSGNSPDVRGLGIKDFLERIGDCTQPNSYAWVVLDIKPPSVITNVSDLEFPLEAIKTELENIPALVRDRLILTLPCNQSEESWVAPEFSNSVFAHFFWEGVLSGFELPKGKISLDVFEKALSDKVSKWVALNRNAQQSPRFLMSDNTQKSKSKIVLFNTDTAGAKLSIASTNIASELQSKFDELDKLWERLLEVEYCSQTDPIAYATIESQLIQMEDLAESNSQRWKDFKLRAAQEIEVLETKFRFDRRASLIESALHGRALSSGQFDKNLLKESTSPAAPWLKNPPFWREASSSVVANPPNRNDRCLQVWTVLQQIARSDEGSQWTESLVAERLEQYLKYVAPNDREKDPEWLEIQFVQILRDALGTSAQSDSARSDAASKAIALAIKTFADIHEIAFAVNPELSRWTRKDLLELDALFLAAIDDLVANQFSPCAMKLVSMKENVQKLSQFTLELDVAMKLRDRTIRLAPHILAGLMREFRYETSQQDPWTQLAQELGIATTKAHKLKDTLSSNGVFNPSIAGGTNDTELAGLVDRLENKFREFGKLAPSDPESFRKCRTALRWPLLDINVRRSFHSQLSKFYQRDSKTSAEDTKRESTKLVHQAPSLIAKSFQESLGEFRDKELYLGMMKQDPRHLLGRLEHSNDNENKLADETNGRLESIYMTSYSTRLLANALGQRIFAGQQRKDKWPWNSPSQFSDVNLNEYCSLQADRLSLAQWGDGDLDANQVQGKYYFERLVAMFRSKAPDLKGYDQASPLAANFEKAYAKTKGASSSVRSIGFSNPSVETDENDFFRITLEGMELNAESPKSIASVSIGRTVRKRIKSARGDLFVEPIPLNSPRRVLEVTQDAILGEDLFVSHRGHFRGYPIPLPKLADNSKLEFKREPNQGSTLRIRSASSEPITLLVLLDCSHSMSYEGLFEKAKSTVQSLLIRIQELNRSDECKVNVGLIAFGRKMTEDDSVPIPRDFANRDSERQVYATAVKEGSEIETLKELLKSPWLKPSDCTPLYDAISMACDMCKEGRGRIVVVSDGSNDVYSDFYKGAGVRVDDLKAKLRSSKAALFVYQNDNMGYYTTPDSKGRTFDADKISAIKNSNAELQQLVNAVSNKSSNGNVPNILYKDFESITKAIEASLPFSTVTISAGEKTIAGGRFGQDIEIPAAAIPPSIAQVEIQSLGNKQTSRVRLIGNEKLEFEYLAQKNELNFINFDKDRLLRELGDFGLPLRADSKCSLALFAKPIPEQSNFRLRFEIAIRREPRLDEEKTFTRRPAFAVAELRSSGDERSESTLISDFNFVVGTHYPVLRSPLVKMTATEWDANRADLNVWIAEELPKFIETVSLKSVDNVSVFEDQIAITRNGSKVAAKITSKERFFIICPACRSSTRQLAGKKEQKAEFELPDSKMDDPVEIQVVKLSDVLSAESEGGLQKHSFKSRPFRK